MSDIFVFEVRDLQERWIVGSREELLTIAEIRYDGRNSIWIKLKDSDVPNLNVGFHNNLAVVNYFNRGEAEDDMAVSKGDGSARPVDGTTPFFLTEFGVEQEMANSVVIDSHLAAETLMDFFENPYARPKSIDWLEL